MDVFLVANNHLRAYHQTYNSSGSYAFDARYYSDFSYEPHFHRHYELMYVEKGTVECQVDGQVYRVEEGTFVLCLPTTVHGFTADASAVLWVGVFSADFVTAFDRAIEGKAATCPCFTVSDAMMAFLRENLLHPDAAALEGRAGYDPTVTCPAARLEELRRRLPYREQAPLFTLKACLYAVCAAFKESVALTDRRSRHSALIHEVTDYMAANFARDITLQDLATHFGYEYSYMSRIFKQSFSMSFSEYLNVCRYNHAVTCLVETELSVTEIAERCGYRSVRTFNDVFLKRAGISPTRFKQQRDHTALSTDPEIRAKRGKTAP